MSETSETSNERVAEGASEPKSKGVDRTTLLIVAGFVGGLALLLALNMK